MHNYLGESWAAIGRTRGGLNSELHMFCDELARPLTFFLSPGQMSDAKARWC